LSNIVADRPHAAVGVVITSLELRQFHHLRVLSLYTESYHLENGGLSPGDEQLLAASLPTSLRSFYTQCVGDVSVVLRHFLNREIDRSCLEEMHIAPSASDDDPAELDTPLIEAFAVSCQQLRELTFSCVELDEANTLLAFSRFPALRDLELHCCWWPSVQTVAAFLALWHRRIGSQSNGTHSYILARLPPVPNLLPQPELHESARLDANKSARPNLTLGYYEDTVEEVEDGESLLQEGDLGTRTWLEGMRKLQTLYANTIEVELRHS
jgi:hypothetical protein